MYCSTGNIVLSQRVEPVSRLTLLLFGDVNLGRSLGQELIEGKIDYPFARMRELFRSVDGVFVNLESQLTDQNGETESPHSNYVFCAPPVGAKALKRGGVTLVSTANNHAFDYTLKGLQETIRYLVAERITFVGTSYDSVRRFPPVVLTKRGIRIGFLAYTQIVNAAGPWEGRISVFDSLRARKDIGLLRPNTDYVIVSFHGGQEYADKPNEKTLRQMRSLINAGADVVVGHHPHVPQGIEEYQGKLIFYSLGNFVFNQAQEWAKRSFGVGITFRRLDKTVGIESVRLIPIRAYKQPAMDLPDDDRRKLIDRLQSLSNMTIIVQRDTILVTSTHTDNFQ